MRQRTTIFELILSAFVWIALFLWLFLVTVIIANADEGDICTSSAFCYCPDNRAPICIKDNVGTLGHCVCL